MKQYAWHSNSIREQSNVYVVLNGTGGYNV